MSLEEIRGRIDALDQEIVSLLKKRTEAGREAAAEKSRQGLPLRDVVRERAVLDRLAGHADAGLSRQALENIYRAIIAETLAAEESDASCPGPAVAGKMDVGAVIVENAESAPGFFRMRLRAPGLETAFRPGQFFQLRLERHGNSPFLRRPFAPSESTADGFAFHYGVVGEGTRHMSRLAPGQRVGVLAPLGNAYTDLPAGASALLVGGGCGAPSLAPLARHLRDAGVKTVALVGARSAQSLLAHDSFRDVADRLVVATDDGSHGFRGTAIDAYHREIKGGPHTFDRMYACGPIPMLRGVAALAEETGIDCEVSLEERMACGFGACVGCAVPVLDASAEGGYAYRRVCHEGPVFNSRVLAWDRMR